LRFGVIRDALLEHRVNRRADRPIRAPRAGVEQGPGFPVYLEGATVVEVDRDGLVTRWRDYLVDPAFLGHDESMGSVESHWALMEPQAIKIDGDRIAYRAAGEGPVLLLIHGLAGSAVTWRHVMPALAERV